MRLAVIAVTALALSSSPIVMGRQSNDGELPLKLSAFAVSLGGPRMRSGTEQLELTIKRWSTDSERQRLREAIAKGQDEALKVLQGLQPVGTIRTPDTVAYDLHYAHQIPGEDGGRRIFLATDRPIGFWEARNRPRSIDYPFTFIELRLDANGQGEGKLNIATRIISSSDGRYVQLENYTAQPVQLNQVRVRS